MKKISIYIMTLFIAMTETASLASAQEGLNLSLKATPKLSFLENSDDNNSNAVQKKAVVNANFGLGLGYNITGNFGLGLEALYSFQGRKIKIAGIRSDQELEYFKIPFYLSFNTDASKSVSFFGKFGPQISFLTDARESTGSDGHFRENKEEFENSTVGAMICTGAQCRLSRNLFLQTGLYFDFDITNAEDVYSSGFYSGRANTYNMNAGIQLGLKYSL